MTVELTMLTWVAALHSIMWVPYILNAVMVRGLVAATLMTRNLWLPGRSA